MAKAVDQQDIEINLGVIESALEVLPSYAETPDDWTGWDSEWDDVMARFQWLLELAAAGDLNAEQSARCEASLRSLSRQLPLAESLGLYAPDAILEAIGRQPAAKREAA